jgi:hypothetical protein
MRGRAIGVLLMAIFGMMPLGSLLVGGLSQRIGAPATVVGEGVVSILVALVFYSQAVDRVQEDAANHSVQDRSQE